MGEPAETTFFHLADAKAWLKIETTADDGPLAVALAAAEQFVAADAGRALSALSEAEIPLAKAAVFSLAGHYRRNVVDVTAPVELREVPLGIARILLQLRAVPTGPLGSVEEGT